MLNVFLFLSTDEVVGFSLQADCLNPSEQSHDLKNSTLWSQSFTRT